MKIISIIIISLNIFFNPVAHAENVAETLKNLEQEAIGLKNSMKDDEAELQRLNSISSQQYEREGQLVNRAKKKIDSEGEKRHSEIVQEHKQNFDNRDKINVDLQNKKKELSFQLERMRIDLIRLREEKSTAFAVQKLYQEYLSSIEKLNEDFKNLNKEFNRYLDREAKNVEDYLLNSNRIQTAKDIDSILNAKLKLEQIYEYELESKSRFNSQCPILIAKLKNCHRIYKKLLNSHHDFIKKNKYKEIKQAHSELNHLQKILSYTDQRFGKFQMQLLSRFQDASNKFIAITENEIALSKKDREEFRKKSRMDSLFIDEIHNSIKAIHASVELMNQSPYGLYLEPRYRAYQQVLAYKELCQAAMDNRTQLGHLINGCSIIQRHIKDAESFMNELVWIFVGNSLSKLLDSPHKDLEKDSETLYELYKNRKSNQSRILEVIQLHDSLIAGLKTS